MKKSILSLSLAFLGLGAFTTSCEDMLTPDMDRYATEFTGTDSINFYLGIMRNMQGMIEQNVLLGDLRSDLVSPTEYVADSVNEIVNFANLEDGESALLNRAAYYKVINQCNYYLAKVDSMAMKNNSYFMRRELAQVELVRAWTYMQLVQNYGKVPFITKPIDNASTGWETTPPEGWANADNLIELLDGVEGQSLTQAYNYSETYGYPNYGTFNNGAKNISHKLMLFNADLVMGDLYLLRGRSTDDYEKAAHHYHKYLDEDCNVPVTGRAFVFKLQRNNEDPVYSVSSLAWSTDLTPSSWTDLDEIRTAIPSAANSFFGQVLTSIPQIYGFETTSGASSETVTNEKDDGSSENVTTTSGRINVTANYKMRQLAPSPAYEALNRSQAVVYNEENPLNRQEYLYSEYPEGVFDGRFDACCPEVRTELGRLRFVQKYCGSNYTSTAGLSPSAFSFRYAIPVYRTRQIYLKYAEAVNRAGFPRHAFAILRDGLYPKNMPTISSNHIVKSDTTWIALPDPEVEDDFGDIATIENTYMVLADSANNDYRGANCIDLNELYRAQDKPWLNFENFENKPNLGIHQAGCGMFLNLDTEFTYENQVARRIAQEAERSGQSLSHDLVQVAEVDGTFKEDKETYIDHNGAKDYYIPSSRVLGYKVYGPYEDEIAAVETLIADEMALELAFEGCRYYDLMRIARHRNNAGLDGSAWMAWLISRRDLGLAPYEQSGVVGPLYDRLSNPDNWYLPAPKND